MTNEVINVVGEVTQQAMQWPEAFVWSVVAVAIGVAFYGIAKYQ